MVRVQEAWWTADRAGLEGVRMKMRRLDKDMPWKWARSQLGRIMLPPTIFRSKQGACGMETSLHLAVLSRGPEVWRKGSQVLRKLKGGVIGMGSRHTLAKSNSSFVFLGYSTPTSSR